jgi:hypothetical protein
MRFETGKLRFEYQHWQKFNVESEGQLIPAKLFCVHSGGKNTEIVRYIFIRYPTIIFINII